MKINCCKTFALDAVPFFGQSFFYRFNSMQLLLLPSHCCCTLFLVDKYIYLKNTRFFCPVDRSDKAVAAVKHLIFIAHVDALSQGLRNCSSWTSATFSKVKAYVALHFFLENTFRAEYLCYPICKRMKKINKMYSKG